MIDAIVILVLGTIGVVAIIWLTFATIIATSKAITYAGTRVPPVEKDGLKVHSVAWGCKYFSLTLSVAMIGLVLALIHDSVSIWPWLVSTPWFSGWFYVIVATLLYRVVHDHRTIRTRGWRLRWSQHEWRDLSAVEYVESEYHWRLRFGDTGEANITVSTTGLGHLLAVANEALERNRLKDGSKNA